MAIKIEVKSELTDGAVQQVRAIVREEIAEAEARARPHGKVIDDVYHPCGCGDATAVHDISLPGETKGLQ